MNRKLLFIPLVLFLALAAALFWQLMRNAEGDDPTTLESALIGKPLPEFRLEALNTPGQTLDRRTLIDGKPLLLNVWATWCPTCRAEHQFLNGLAQQGVRVVELSVPLGNIPKAMFYPLGKLALRRLYRKAVKLYGRPDLLHAHFTDYAYLASLLADEEQLPLVVTENSSLVKKRTAAGFLAADSL